MNILVTGSNGFIGSSLIKVLLKNKKYKIFATYNKKKPNIKTGNINFLKIDLIKDKLEKKIKSKIDLIYHFANFDTYSLGQNKSQILVSNNSIHQNVIHFSKKFKSRLIFLSSSEVSKKINKTIMKETDSIIFQSYAQDKLPYRLSKFLGEFLLYDLNIKDYLILRLNNVYGPGMKKGQVIRDLIEKIKKNPKKIIVNNGECKRNFIYIDDLILILIQFIKIKPKEKIMNIASSQTVKIGYVAKIIKKILNKKVILNFKIEKNSNSKYDKIPDLTLMKKYNLRCKTMLFNGIKNLIHTENIS